MVVVEQEEGEREDGREEDKEEERLFLVALNEIYRGIRDQVSHVAFAING